MVLLLQFFFVRASVVSYVIFFFFFFFFFVVFSSSHLLFVPRKGCALWLYLFLSTFKYFHDPNGLCYCLFRGRGWGDADADPLSCSSSSVASLRKTVCFVYFCGFMFSSSSFPHFAFSDFFLFVLLYCLELQQEIRERFHVSKTGLRPPPHHIQTTPTYYWLLCYSSSLYVCASMVSYLGGVCFNIIDFSSLLFVGSARKGCNYNFWWKSHFCIFWCILHPQISCINKEAGVIIFIPK